MNKYLVIFDVETTGLSPQYDWIIQLSAIKIDKSTMKPVDKFNSYILPAGEWYITPEAEAVHGLSNDFIKNNGKPIKEVGPEFIKFIDGCDMGGYNSNNFDVKFLYKDFAYSGITFSLENRIFYDMLRMEQRLHPNNLRAVFQRYTGQTMEEAGLKAHDSSVDVVATAIVLAKQMETNGLTFEEIDTWDENKLLTPDGSIRQANPSVIVFNNGKYKDKDIYEVMKSDPSYCRWWSQNVASTYTVKIVKEYCKKKMQNN